MGRLYKPARGFQAYSGLVFMQKRAAYYLCNAYPYTLAKTIKKLPKELGGLRCI